MINVRKPVLDMISRMTYGRIISSDEKQDGHLFIIGKCKNFMVKYNGDTPIAYLTKGDELSLCGSMLITGTSE